MSPHLDQTIWNPILVFFFEYFHSKDLAFATTNHRPFEFPLTSRGKKIIFSGTVLSLSVYNIQILSPSFMEDTITAHFVSQ